MPNRIIKESCRTSTSLDSISADAERLFWRLITTADDFGRFEADLRVILSNCFPLKVEMLRVKKIGEWMEELCKADLVRAYSVNGKRFGYFPTWDKHQQRRAKHSKFPAPAGRAVPDAVGASVMRPDGRGSFPGEPCAVSAGRRIALATIVSQGGCP